MPDQQTVVITGASDGIGAAAARQLAERDYRVVVMGRSPEKTAAVAWDGDAKLANVLFTKELHRRYHEQGIAAAAFHPGGIATSFAHDTPSPMRLVYRTPLRRLLGSADKGGRRLVWLVEGTPEVTWRSGEYHERNKPGKVNPQVRDAALARGLC